MVSRKSIVLSALLYGFIGYGLITEGQNAPLQAQEPLPLEKIRDLLSTWADVEANCEMLITIANESCEDTNLFDLETDFILLRNHQFTRGEIILHELAGAIRGGQPGPTRSAVRDRFQDAVIDLFNQNKPGLRRPILLEVLALSKHYIENVTPEPDTSKEIDFFVKCLNDQGLEVRKQAFRFLCHVAYRDRSLYDELVPLLEKHIAESMNDEAEIGFMRSSLEQLQGLISRLPGELAWDKGLRIAEQNYWKVHHMSDQELLELLSGVPRSMEWDLALDLITQEAASRAKNLRELRALLDRRPAEYSEIIVTLARPVPETASDEIKIAEDMFVDYLESAFDEATNEPQRLNIISAMKTLASERRYREEFKGGTEVHGEPHSRERVLTLIFSYLNHESERTRLWAQRALKEVAPERLKEEQKQ